MHAHAHTTTAFDFDVLVGGHLTRTGTRQDVYTQVAYFNDVLEGVRLVLI